MNPSRSHRALLISLVLALVLALATGCAAAMGMLHRGVVVPPASEFGLGPRTSSSGRLTAVLAPDAPLKVGALQSARITIRDREGAPVRGAAITIDGGMPQHGHGLPTRPRVTREAGEGGYLVDGLRFNMGGWWELRFTVSRATVADTLTFNVRL